MTTANIMTSRSLFQTSPHCQKITGIILKVSAIAAAAAAAIALYVGSLVAVVMATATAIVSAWAGKRISVLPSPLSKLDSNPPADASIPTQSPAPNIPLPPPMDRPTFDQPPNTAGNSLVDPAKSKQARLDELGRGAPPSDSNSPADASIPTQPLAPNIPAPPPMDFSIGIRPPGLADNPPTDPASPRQLKPKPANLAQIGKAPPELGDELKMRLAAVRANQKDKEAKEEARLKKEAEEKRKADEAEKTARLAKEAEDKQKADEAAAKIAQETAEKAQKEALEAAGKTKEEIRQARWKALEEAPLPPRPQRLPQALALAIASAQLKRVEKEQKSATPLQVPKPVEESWSASSTLSDKNQLDLDGVDAARIKRKIAEELLSAAPS